MCEKHSSVTAALADPNGLVLNFTRGLLNIRVNKKEH
jgi:hypothetical protein